MVQVFCFPQQFHPTYYSIPSHRSSLIGPASFRATLASCFFRKAFWMKHFGHMCLKRTLLWSTAWAIGKFDMGPIKKGTHKSLVKTAAKYVDKMGKTRYKGTGKDLKNTQLLSQQWFILLFALFEYAIPPKISCMRSGFQNSYFYLLKSAHWDCTLLALWEPSWRTRSCFMRTSRSFQRLLLLKRCANFLSLYPLDSDPLKLGIFKLIWQVQPEEAILNSILSMETGDPWDDAELWSVYRYIRGSKNLALPQSYRPVLFQRAN